MLFIIIYVVIGMVIELWIADKSMETLMEFGIFKRSLLFLLGSLLAPVWLVMGIIIGIIENLKKES